MNCKTTFKSCIIAFLLLNSFLISAQVVLETEVKITDMAMYFDGQKVPISTSTNSTTGYDYAYGPALTPHGDCIKVYDKYVFLTWYRGGKLDRHVMLTRYNTETGVQKTIEFPHQHTGYNNKWWIGETHNTIAVGICPKDGTIHMVYDMHRNGNVAAFANDYLRYSYTTANAATVLDDEFTIDLFVQSPNNNYKHLAFPGINDVNTTKLLTYPAFFTNDQGDLFMKNRFGYSENGKFLFAKYDGNDWEGYTDFNRMVASSHGSSYNWGLYGDIKYLNGKIRIGFQQRANIRTDKYQYQNGFYYAYSDDPSGLTQWKDHTGTSFDRPLAISDKIKISEPGDLVSTTALDQVKMVSGFDWTVTDNGDVHFIGKVIDNENSVTKQVHTYKPFGATEFITTTDFSGAETLYAFGDKVYIIGLTSSGRPFVESAQGGTNLFTRVYEATSGKRFRKGQVYIHDGKLYYYLLENNAADADDTQPTYLQIIDLGIDSNTPFAVQLLAPSNNQEFDEGKNVQVIASATTDKDEITKVAFYLDNNLLQEDTTKPYTLDWTPAATGTYLLKAIAYRTGGESIESDEISVKINEVDKSDLTKDVFRLRNKATGKFLGAGPGTATPVVMSETAETDDTHWTFVKTTVGGVEYYNIDSNFNGVLRSTGSGYSDPYLVLSTGKSPTTGDSDKIWKLHFNETNNTFRFESKTNNRYLYQDPNNNVYNISIPDTDLRSVWEAIPSSQSLSISAIKLKATEIEVVSNLKEGRVTIVFQNLSDVELSVYSVLGKEVFRGATKSNTINLTNVSSLSSGIYILKVLAKNNQTYMAKIFIN
ncbi:BNR-4 repeat-containing protein [Wenyingzhuangia sp. IMCC45574]